MPMSHEPMLCFFVINILRQNIVHCIGPRLSWFVSSPCHELSPSSGTVVLSAAVSGELAWHHQRSRARTLAHWSPRLR